MNAKNQTQNPNAKSSTTPNTTADASTPKRGRKPGPMTEAQKSASKANRIQKMLTSKDVRTVDAWKNVPEEQINAIMEVAKKAHETVKTERIAALTAELKKLQGETSVKS